MKIKFNILPVTRDLRSVELMEQHRAREQAKADGKIQAAFDEAVTRNIIRRIRRCIVQNRYMVAV